VPQPASRPNGAAALQVAENLRRCLRIVSTVDFDAVSREVNDGDIGVANGVGKIAQSATHLAHIEVAFQLNDIEAAILPIRQSISNITITHISGR
jgi:hypothetical protein